jgi:hypothetical protein
MCGVCVCLWCVCVCVSELRAFKRFGVLHFLTRSQEHNHLCTNTERVCGPLEERSPYCPGKRNTQNATHKTRKYSMHRGIRISDPCFRQVFIVFVLSRQICDQLNNSGVDSLSRGQD